MLTLLIGRAGAGKSAQLISSICKNQRRQILIVPEQFSHEAERRLCQTGGNGISRNAEVLSFTRLSSRVCALCGGSAARTLDAGGRLLLMYRAVKSVSEHLALYSRPSKKPAFLAGLLTTLDECKSYCVSPAALGEAATQTGGLEGDKLGDLSLIFGAYDALCARVAADPRDKLTRLARRIIESGWGKDTDVFVDGFTDFTPQEGLVLSALMRQGCALTVALTCDGLEEDGESVFAPARRTAAFLLRLAQTAGIPAQVVHPPKREEHKAPSLQFLEQNLMEGGAAFTAPCPNVERFAATSPWSEVEWAASRILGLVQSEGYRFREVAVAARKFEGYDELVETIFARYGIPVFLSKTSDVLEKPILALITSALETVSGGYGYDDVFRYLKTGLTDLSDEERDLLENYVLKWDIRGSRWTAKADWTMHPGGFGIKEKEEDRALRMRLDGIRRRVVAPLEALRKGKDKTGRGHAVAIYQFMEEIHLPERLAQRMEGLRQRGELGLAEEYRQLWDIVRGGLEQCALLLDDAPMELEEFSRLFSLVLSQYDVGTIPVSLDRVTAGECTRLGYRTVKVLLLLGCDDGAMPLAAPSPGLFTDDDRALLAELGLTLAPRLADKLDREMTIVYAATCAPTERLLVSWAEGDAAGGEQRPAFLVGRLGVLFPSVPLVREREGDGLFRLSAPAPALEMAGELPALGAVLKTMEAYRGKVERMERGLALTRGRLSPKTVSALYGAKVSMSASRMDLYRSCHFSYFMRYGLEASPRESAGFEAPEYGTFVHYILEHVLQYPRWGELDAAAQRAVTAEVAERYVTEEMGGLEDKTPRFQYLFRRLLASINLIVENVTAELSCSQFQPLAFELGFGGEGTLPPVEFVSEGLTVSVTGFVDRVDGWVKDERLYLRVVDYKTGRKSFDLTDVWNGMGLQMLLYLFTLEKSGKALFGYDVTPAGVLYLPARDLILPGTRATTAAEQQKDMDAELRRRGLLLGERAVLDAMEHPGEAGIRFLPVRLSAASGEPSGESLVDAEGWGKLGRHMEKILGEIGSELARGNIAADPFWRGSDHNACQFCDYAAACQFEEAHGDGKRYLQTMTGKEFWARLEDASRG